MEVQAIWCRQLTGISVLFLFNRYMLLLSVIVDFYINTPQSASRDSCNIMNHVQYACGMATVASTSALFAMRVYTIHARKRWILIVATVPVLARMGIDIWILAKADIASVYNDPLDRSIWNRSCEFIQNDAILTSTLEMSSNAIALFFDTFVLALTLGKAYHHVVEMHRLKRASITQVIVRDGVLYFLLIFGLRPPLQTSDYMTILGGVVGVYYNYAPNMLVNRLVLNLRMYDSEQPFVKPHLSTMVFADTSTESRVLGNIGAPLDHDQWSHGQGEPVDEPSEL